MADIETIVVGAGVVGLAIAASLARRGEEVLVLERDAQIGSETSARNSEVIHAGIYYPPGSLRAKLCLAGKEQLYRFCTDNGVACRRYGKLLVATDESQTAKLETIARNAERNGVEGMRRLTAQEAQSLEPELACVAAYLSETTGVVDSHGLMQSLEGHLTVNNGQVVLNTSVKGISAPSSAGGEFRLTTESAGEDGIVTATRLVLAGGLAATELGRMLDYPTSYRPPETHFARGHYFALSGRAPFDHLIYPMPQGAWLGVHLTLDVAGRAKFGPDIEWVDTVDYTFDDPDGARRSKFEREVRRYWPSLPDDGLQPDYVGVRPKIYKEGEPVPDFAIHGRSAHGIEKLVALYGIESPGLTSSLAIADMVADMLG